MDNAVHRDDAIVVCRCVLHIRHPSRLPRFLPSFRSSVDRSRSVASHADPGRSVGLSGGRRGE